jgi:hypothetical protein
VKTNIWIGLAFLVTFILGLTTGYLIPRDLLNTPRNAWMHDTDVDRPNPQPREMEARKRLMEVLDLNEEQQIEFEKASSTFQQEVRRTLQESNLETREKIRQHNELLDTEMRRFLNDQQYARWQKFHQRRMRILQERGERWRQERRFSN